MGIYVEFDGIVGLFEQARREGRDFLFEHEVYELIRLIGGETIPRYVLLARGERLTGDKLSAIPGEKVVIKAVSPYIVHKSDVGAVRIVPKELDRVLSAVRAMTYEVPETYVRSLEHAPDRTPDAYRGLAGESLLSAVSRDIRGLLLVQHMPVSQEFGNELIASLRVTREFGTIISAGLGGTDTELYTDSLKKGRAVVAASTEMTDGDSFFRLFQETISYKKLAGLTRGQKRIVTDEQLLECFSALIALGNYFSPSKAKAPFVIRELEVNPFAFANYLMLPLDGLCRFTLPDEPVVFPRPIVKIEKLLHPETIGVVGVSEKEINVGRTIVRNILANGFAPSALNIVHPKAPQIEGVTTVPALNALPGKLDLLILAVRAEQAAEMVGQIIDGDLAESVILVPGGLGEVTGSEQRSRLIGEKIHQAHLKPDGGPVFIGGNSLGILSHPGRYDSLFIPESKLPKQRGDYPRKSVLISQSGAFMIARMSKLRCMDPAYALSIGNQIDLTAGDVLNFINRRPEIQTIAAYIEGFNDLDGLVFARAVREAVLMGKEMVLYKAGRTQEGKTATSGHTASIAGDYMVCESCMHQGGAMVADNFTEFEGLFSLAHALHEKAVSGKRLAAVCNAGFESVGVADNILGEDFTMEMASLAEESRSRLSEILHEAGLGALVEVKNPLDLTPMAAEEVYESIIEALFEDGNVDAIVAGVTPLAPLLRTLPEEMAAGDFAGEQGNIHQRLARQAGRFDKPLVLVIDGGSLYDPLARAFEEVGLPVFRSADQAVRILGKYIDGRLHAQKLRSTASGAA
ncbi:MAG: acetate--CoA ligase family protein [Deltaproteobacteria bacterium]|nr:acetate--CoA ligase family protein [Deltaproteobacteria bacterium]